MPHAFKLPRYGVVGCLDLPSSPLCQTPEPPKGRGKCRSASPPGFGANFLRAVIPGLATPTSGAWSYDCLRQMRDSGVPAYDSARQVRRGGSVVQLPPRFLTWQQIRIHSYIGSCPRKRPQAKPNGGYVCATPLWPVLKRPPRPLRPSQTKAVATGTVSRHGHVIASRDGKVPDTDFPGAWW